MRRPATAADPPRRRLRHFAWLAALVLAVIAWYEDPSWPLRIAAAFVFAMGTVLPSTFRLPYRILRSILRPAFALAGFPGKMKDKPKSLDGTASS
jgi:Flp pilus assembly protein TadB